MDTPTWLSLVKVLAPSLTLLAAAGLVAALSARLRSGTIWSQAIAALALVVALILATLQIDHSTSLAGVPLGPVSVSLIELRYSPLTLTWMQLLFLSMAALVLVSPPEAIPISLALVGISAPALMIGSFPALCLTWFLVEVALAAIGPSPATGNTWFPLIFGTAAVLAAFHTSASDEALILSLGSLRPVSWLLLVTGVALRARWWSPATLASGSVLPSIPYITATATGFFTLSHLESTPRGGEVPGWLWLALLLVCIATALLAWGHRRSGIEVVLRSAAALLMPLVLLEAMSLPPAPWIGAAVAHVLVAAAIITVLSRMDLPTWLPTWTSLVVGAIVALTLLPWPILPYGRAMAAALEALSSASPGAAVLLALGAGLPAGALLAAPRYDTGGTAHTSAQLSTTGAALLLSLLSVALVWSLSTTATTSDTALLYAGPSLGAMAMGVLGGFLGLVLAVVDRTGLLAALDSTVPSGIDTAFARAGSWLVTHISATAETVFRFLEGETPLTWAVLIGTAVLILAAGQL